MADKFEYLSPREFQKLGKADKFEYLSPREFQKLGKADKDRYLLALYRHLHTQYLTQEDVDFSPKRKRSDKDPPPKG